MKIYHYIGIAALALTVLTGCKSGQKKTDSETTNKNLIQPEMSLSAKDTTEVRRLTRQYLTLLENRELGRALQMLSYYEDKEIKPLPSELLNKEAMVLNMFLGMKAEIDHIIFFRDNDNEVKYTITLFDRTDETDHRPNKASFLLRPVRYRGKWYLTLADNQTDKVKSEIKH